MGFLNSLCYRFYSLHCFLFPHFAFCPRWQPRPCSSIDDDICSIFWLGRRDALYCATVGHVWWLCQDRSRMCCEPSQSNRVRTPVRLSRIDVDSVWLPSSSSVTSSSAEDGFQTAGWYWDYRKRDRICKYQSLRVRRINSNSKIEVLFLQTALTCAIFREYFYYKMFPC